MGNLRWELLSPYGILVDETLDAWWSGHVTDLLELDGGAAGLLVATEMGGVWLVPTNNIPLPLSDKWDQPNVNRLAAGPDGPRHFYAACDGGIIYETDTSTNIPLLAWQPVADPLPANAGDVRGIAVVHPQRIVVAATDGGVFWSHIPRKPEPRGCLSKILPLPPPPGPPKYEWKQAVAPEIGQGGYFDVTIGSFSGRREDLMVRGLAKVSVVVGAHAKGVFVGRWRDPDTLSLEGGRIVDEDGDDVTDWWFLVNGYTSVAVCEAVPNVLYAACAYPDGRFKMVIRSTDGGRRWSITSFDLKNFPGLDDIRAAAGDLGQGWNNCIGVMKNGPGVVAVGWQAGTFVSPDAGATWIAVQGSAHLHSDVHVVRFRDTTVDDQVSLLIGSDGGIAEISVNDAFQFKTTARSDFNRQLPTLQCYSTWPIPRQFYGTLAVGDSGFVATGVQDNGNLYLHVDSGAPWRQLDGGDGGWTAFLDGGPIARNVMGQAVTVGFQSGPLLKGAEVPPIKVPAPDVPEGLKAPVGDPVRLPRFRNRNRELMLAAAGLGPNIYGLFSDRNLAGTFHWDRIGVLPADKSANAVASHDGATVHVGTSDGRFYAVDSKSGFVFELGLTLPRPAPGSEQSNGYVTRIATLSSTVAFALLNSTNLNLNYVLRLDGLRWRPPLLTGLPIDRPFYGLDGALRESDRLLFVSTDEDVYLSTDGGENWTRESDGLPARPHGADIRVATLGRGGFVYLSTFGRSVYRSFVGEIFWAP